MKNLNRDSYSNIVFNLDYALKIKLGLILSVSVFIFLFKMEIKKAEEIKSFVISTQEEVFVEEIIQTKNEIKVPAPPRPSIPIEVPNDEILEDEIIDIDAELNFEEALELPKPPPIKDSEEVADEEIFIVVENPPVLIGGLAALQKKIEYPRLAKEAGIEGRVIIEFVIDKEGNVINPFVLRGIGGGCDEEALKRVSQVKFKPGLQRGRPVQVRYTIPVTFRLEKAERNSN